MSRIYHLRFFVLVWLVELNELKYLMLLSMEYIHFYFASFVIFFLFIYATESSNILCVFCVSVAILFVVVCFKNCFCVICCYHIHTFIILMLVIWCGCCWRCSLPFAVGVVVCRIFQRFARLFGIVFFSWWLFCRLIVALCVKNK